MHHTSGCQKVSKRGTAGLPCGNAKGLSTPGDVLCFAMCCDPRWAPQCQHPQAQPTFLALPRDKWHTHDAIMKSRVDFVPDTHTHTHTHTPGTTDPYMKSQVLSVLTQEGSQVLPTTY